MRFGAAFPQREIPNDPEAIRAYVQAVRDLGYDHLVVFDRGVSADIPGQPRSRSAFHEPFVLLAFIAACADGLGLAQAVTVLPLRQTVLVARQAAELDILAKGRTRLGVGIGRNAVEYAAYGTSYRDRTGRIGEQIHILRRLFTEDLIDYEGRWHRLDHIGINPRPLQRPIPIWMGGTAEPSVRRVARLADGWFTQAAANAEGARAIEAFRGHLRTAGRDSSDFPIEARINAFEGDADSWSKSRSFFAAAAVSDVYFSTMDAGCRSVEDHISLLERFRDIWPAAATS